MCSSSETVLIDASNGTQMDVIPYGNKAPKEDIPYLIPYFAASTCLVPEKEWLICGTEETKRIRILSLNPPHPVLKEVGNTGINGLGIWSTDHLTSAAHGRLLLTESEWGSRLWGKTETVILDTDTWKVLWRAASDESAFLSPDGKRLGIFKGNKMLEILPFGGAN
jgi:hypothetical protein